MRNKFLTSATALGLAGLLMPLSAFAAPPTLTEDLQKEEVIAACVIEEAGVEGENGMHAVMNVIQNRALGNPGGYYAVVTSPTVQQPEWNLRAIPDKLSADYRESHGQQTLEISALDC